MIGRPMTSRSAPAARAASGVATRIWSLLASPVGRTPAVMSVTSLPTSARTAATSWGLQTSALAPALTASTARRRTASAGGPSSPTAARSSEPSDVRTVTPATRARGSSSTAARTIAAPPAACTVRKSGRSRATDRAAPATVAGMSCSFRSRNSPAPLPPRTTSTTSGPYRQNSASPTLSTDTCGLTDWAHRAAVSRSGASRATATGALRSSTTVILAPRSQGSPLAPSTGGAQGRIPQRVRPFRGDEKR